MNYSKDGMKLTEGFESCRLTAYPDLKGVWTIGYGHTGHEVVEGLTWTQEHADSELLADVQHAADCVTCVVKIQITQDEFDALVDFTFNAGCHAFMTSTMLMKINAGDITGAAEEFDRWDHASGKVVAGLLRRREAETALFTS
jgi:lysozyme